MNERTIRRWWDLFRAESPLTEIRILGRSKTFSGYFTDCDTALENLRRFENCGGVYAVLNKVKEPCYGRTQHDEIIQQPKSTTNDNDIESRSWILIDFDPERPSDTNASDAEKATAKATMKAVFKYLRDEGFYPPIVADSGNGYHLYYKVDMDNNEENTSLVKQFLQALDAYFSDEKVKVDTSVFNAARIVKIIGTSSNKGKNTEDRPQRESSFIYVPDSIIATPTAFIAKVAGYLPKPEKPSKFNGYSSDRFDLEGFISQHNIGIVRRSKFSGGEKLILKECPFDHNHKDAAILHLDNGAIAFKCFHNSCSHYNWKDFRIHFDPSAYDRNYIEEHQSKRKYYGVQTPQAVQPTQEDDRGKRWLTMRDIKWLDPSQMVSIPSGIRKIDKAIMGFTLGDITILSGLTGSGKTTILDTFILSAVQRGYKVAAWSGELPDSRFQSWLDQMAAGKSYVKEFKGIDGSPYWYCPKNVAEKIHDWFDDRLQLYNNAYGSDWNELRSMIEKVVEDGVQLVILDNLMAIDLDNPSDNDSQTMLIKHLKNLAKTKNIHVILVCHPRKEHMFQLLRKDSIAGTANLVNLCDNLLIVHRVGKDFEKRAKDFWGEDGTKALIYYKDEYGQIQYETGHPGEPGYEIRYNIALEIAKNRSLGVVDAVGGLFYEKETRRVLNDRNESIVYGWQDPPTPGSVFGDIPDNAYNETEEKKTWYNEF